MFTKRMLAAAYVVLLFSLATFWFGLHSLPKWVLFAVFFVGFFAAGFTVIYPWANYRRTKAQILNCVGGHPFTVTLYLMKIKLSQIIRMFKFCFGYLFLAAAICFFVWALYSMQLTGLHDFAVLVVITLVHGSLGFGLLKSLSGARYCATMYCVYVAFCIYLAQPKIYYQHHLTLECPFALPLCFLAIGFLIWWPESWLVKKIENGKLL